MLRSKHRITGLTLACLLAFCPAALAESGLSAPPTAPSAVNEKTAEVIRGEFIRTAMSSASVVYPVYAELSLKEGEGIFVSMHVRRGDEVKAGDVLATFTRDQQTVRHETLKLNLKRAKETLYEGIAARGEAIAQANAALAQEMDMQTLAAMRLEIEKLSLQLKRFEIEQAYRIETIAMELAELEAFIQDTAIVAPFDGVVESIAAKTAGATVRAGETLVTVYSPGQKLLRVSDTNNAFRYGMEAQINGGNRNNPVTFTGQVVAASNILPYTLRQNVVYLTVDDPEGAASQRNLSAIVDTVRLGGVLSVERSALTLTGGVYVAKILSGDMVQKRYVSTSSHRMSELWVLQGLEEGQLLVLE